MKWKKAINHCRENRLILLLVYAALNSSSIILFSIISAIYQIITKTNFIGWSWYDSIGMSFFYSILAMGLSFIFPLTWILHIATGVFIYNRSFKFLYVSLPLHSLIGVFIPNWAVISMGV